MNTTTLLPLMLKKLTTRYRRAIVKNDIFECVNGEREKKYNQYIYEKAVIQAINILYDKQLK